MLLRSAILLCVSPLRKMKTLAVYFPDKEPPIEMLLFCSCLCLWVFVCVVNVLDMAVSPRERGWDLSCQVNKAAKEDNEDEELKNRQKSLTLFFISGSSD